MMFEKKLPIGYWIKQADILLTKSIDDIQSEFGFNRTGWQILNSINEKDNYDTNELIDLLTSFSEAANTQTIINNLSNEGIISAKQNRLSLTKKGKELHAACFEKQKQFRQKIMEGISGHDYNAAVTTLQKIVSNISGNIE